MSAIIPITLPLDRKIAECERARHHFSDCARRYKGPLQQWAATKLEQENLRWRLLMDRRIRMEIRGVCGG